MRKSLTIRLIMFMSVMMISFTSHAQRTATSSESIQAGTWAVRVPYDISAPGTEYRFMSGQGGWRWDFFGLQMRNYSGTVHPGGTNGLGVARIGFTGRFDASYSSLSSTQTSELNAELDNIRWIGVKNVFLLCGVGNSGDQQGSSTSTPSWSTTQRNNYVDDIVRAAEYVESKGYTVYAVAPFNEPDFETTYTGNASNYSAVAAIMQTKPKLAGKVYGPSTLNSSQAPTWYNTVKNNIDFANTHQLAGNRFTDWTGFWQTAKADGKKLIADEMHNVMEMMACAYYGGSAGTWWGYNGVTRGEYTNMLNEGVQLAYKERPNEWMIATVNKRKDNGKTAAFIGSSERQGVATAFTFVSGDRLAYYDGYGPVYDYTQNMPGGASGSYSNGQTNTERTIDICYGESVPIEPINGRYKIVNKATGKVISLTNGNASVRDNVYQWADGGQANQAWDVVPVATSCSDFSYVYIRNANTSTMNLYLDAQAWNMDPGANVSAWSDSDTSGENEWQRWHLTHISDGYYTIRNHLTGLFLDVNNGNTANGTNIMQWSGNGGDNQLWKFVPADHAVDTTKPNAPTGLTATGQSGSVSLSWTANSDADIFRYMVYRYNSNINSWECIGRKVNGTTFIDNTCPKNESLRYRIRALDKSYNLSNPSAEVTAQTTSEHALVARWNGNNMADMSKNKMDAVASPSGLTNETQSTHESFHFNGSNGYVELPYNVGDYQEMTFATWAKGGSTSSWQRIFDFGNGEDSYLFLTPTNGSRMRFEIKANGTTQGLNATTTLGTNTWKHIAVTIGPSEVKIYIDGVLNATATDITLRPSDVKPKLAYLGRSMFDSDPAFNGYLSDVRIYNYELTAAEVQALANITDNTISDYEITAERIPNIADNVNNWDVHTNWSTQNSAESGATNMNVPYVRAGNTSCNLSKTLRYMPSGTYYMQANCYAYYSGYSSRNNQQIFLNTATQTINSARNRTGTLRTLNGGTVGTDHQLSFGYRTTSNSYATNLAMDNVRIFFKGTKEEYLEGLEAITDDILGDATSLLALPMNKDVKAALRAAIDEVTDALSALETSIQGDASDVHTKSDAWIAALDNFGGSAIANAQTSAAEYAKLKEAMDKAEAKAAAHPQTHGGLDVFNSDLGDVYNNYLEGEYLDSEIPATINVTKGIANTYVMTDAVFEARTTNAINVTGLVMDGAGFDDDYLSPDWTVSPTPTGVAYGSLEYWNTNFHIYQVLYGMPAGTYRFETRGFYRYGGQPENYTAHNNGTLVHNAKIYITDGDNTQFIADVMPISDDPSEVHQWGAWSSQLYNGNPVPDNMQAASEAIDVRGKYVPKNGLNAVTLEFAKGGDIIVGARKDVMVGADWTFFGDFSLYYLGNFVTLDEMSDALPTVNTTRSTNVNVELARTISADQWNSICLPFAMSSEQIAAVFGPDAEVRELTDVVGDNGSYTLEFTPVDAMEANKPYIINDATVASNFLIKGVNYSPGTEISVTVNGMVFQGNYTYPTVLDNAGGQDYYLSNNQFKSSKGGTKIKGFRAYFKDPNNMIKTLNFNIEGSATSISGVLSDDGSVVVFPADIYSVSGSMVRSQAESLEGLPQGIYIIGGKKVAIR